MMIISDCPDGWELKPEFSKCYYFINGGTPWSEANQACMALDSKATLTSIQSQEENDYIQSLFQDFVWTGASDEVEEGVWRWVNLGVYEMVAGFKVTITLYGLHFVSQFFILLNFA